MSFSHNHIIINSYRTIKDKGLFLLLVFILLSSCSSYKKPAREAIKFADKEAFILGFMFFDPKNEKTVLELNQNKYFTPASNVKIISLYAALKLLDDSIPALTWKKTNDTLFINSTGDPSLLHPHLKSSRAIDFINNSDVSTVVLDTGNYRDNKYGPGWAWEDYAYYFMPERGAFPMYGNVMVLKRTEDSIDITPKEFSKNINNLTTAYPRSQYANSFNLPETKFDTLEIPFITSDSLTLTLLNNMVNNRVIKGKFPSSYDKASTLYSESSDSVYRLMMNKSDNFLAEQLMILSSSTISDTLSVKKTIEYTLANLLPDMPQHPRWVDGSGLSRYNLFSPHDFVHVLQKMYDSYEKDYLFTLFPAIRLEEQESPVSIPFINAKTGSFSNNYCLSGYLTTKSGRTLIFSFMANHFTIPSWQLKEKLHKMLKAIHEKY
jgi:D-alanyl-D-alanine carboxypeptidase/D-alanyl-D-alanine-endopeptidase (penicillin-binding protein 4)